MQAHLTGPCTFTPRTGTQVFPDGTAAIRRSAAEAAGCAVPKTLDDAWFMRRAAWYTQHLASNSDKQLRMLPVIRIATAHRRVSVRPWNDSDFLAASREPRPIHVRGRSFGSLMRAVGRGTK